MLTSPDGLASVRRVFSGTWIGACFELPSGQHDLDPAFSYSDVVGEVALLSFFVLSLTKPNVLYVTNLDMMLCMSILDV